MYTFRCSATWRPHKKRFQFIHKFIDSEVKTVSRERFRFVQKADQVRT